MEAAKAATRGCGTCKERKIACDRGVPTCQQCARSRRTCKGYQLQLSWPKPGDGKRAMVMKQQRWRKAPDGHASMAATHLVYTHSRDVELHYYLTGPLAARPTLRIPMPYYQTRCDDKDIHLIEYFQRSASQSLTVFSNSPQNLGDTLLRIAFSGGDTPAAKAVLHSILALTSIQRYGVQERAVELKISALKALASAPTDNLDTAQVMQHVAAGMLLCSFEIHQASCTSSQWTWYINGAKEILIATCPGTYRRDEDQILLLDWVHYHDVMSRFTMRHWTGESAKFPTNPSGVWPEGIAQVLPTKLSLPVDDCVDRSASLNMATLRLLSAVFKATSEIPRLPEMSSQEREDYRSYLQLLDWRIKTTPMEPNSKACSEREEIIELHRLAMRVYLNCASGHLLGREAETQQHLDKAFRMFAELTACPRLFPVFILGSQARTDQERAIVLDLMDRTEKHSSSRSLNHVRVLVPTMWAQDDLADGEIDYWKKLTTIISSCSILPSLV